MTSTVLRYSRGAQVTWRDTGRRVVTLAPGTTEVQVLGGGAASIWRALDRPSSVIDIVERLTLRAGLDVCSEDIAACMDNLVAVGLVRETP